MTQADTKWDIVALGYSEVNRGHKVGESRPGLFGGVNTYDSKGNKIKHSDRGLFGGYNHYDD